MLQIKVYLLIFNAVNFKNINFYNSFPYIDNCNKLGLYNLWYWNGYVCMENDINGIQSSFFSDNKTTMKDMKTYTFKPIFYFSFFYVDFYDDCKMLPTAYPVFVMYNKIYKERKENKFNLLNPIFYYYVYVSLVIF